MLPLLERREAVNEGSNGQCEEAPPGSWPVEFCHCWDCFMWESVFRQLESGEKIGSLSGCLRFIALEIHNDRGMVRGSVALLFFTVISVNSY